MSQILLDKALVGATGLQLTPSGDIKTTYGVLANFQTAQIRSLAEITTWLQDEYFGSTMIQLFREKGSYTISEDDLRSSITLAIQPMINDGRLTSIDSILILDRQSDSIFVEIVVTAGTQTGTIPLLIA